MAVGLFKKKNKNEEEFYGDLDNLKNQLGGAGGMSMDIGSNYGMPGTSQNLYDYNTNLGSFGGFGNQNQHLTFGNQGFGQQSFTGTGQQTSFVGAQGTSNQQFGGFGNQNQQLAFGFPNLGAQQVQQPPLQETKPLLKEETKPLLKEKTKEKVNKRHLKDEESLEAKKELLIKIEDYKRVRELLQQLKEKMSEIEKIVNELKEDENKRLESIRGLKEKLEESKSNINSVLDIFR